MKKVFLYYFNLILMITLSQVISILIIKQIQTKLIYLELISRVILLFFLFIQYILYVKLNKPEEEKFEVKYETSSYVFLEQKNNFLSDFYKGKNPIPFNIGLFGSCLILFYLFAILGNNMQFLLLKILGNNSIFSDTGIIYFKALNKLISENLYLSFLLIVLIGPIMEEIIFRGFSLSIKFESTQRIIITIFMSFLFMFLHFDFSRLFQLFAMGLALGIIYNLTESLIYPLSIHILNNGISFGTLFLSKKLKNISIEDRLFEKYNIFNEQGSFKPVWLILIALVLLILTIIETYKKINKTIEEKYLLEKEKL